MTKLKSVAVRASAVTVSTLVPYMALAQSNPFRRGLDDVGAVGRSAGVATTRTLPEIVGGIINVALGFLGIVLLGYILYSGFLWMTSGGEQAKVEAAQKNIRSAIIGLIIIVSAFAISNFVLNSLINVSGS